MLGFRKTSWFTRMLKDSFCHLRRNILSANFGIEKEWLDRKNFLTEITGGREYEWIAAVQKKFVGGGMASAIDVDVAVYGASEKDQLPDIVDLLYKLRHSENAANAMPSTEYAAVRNMLTYDAAGTLLKLVNDPINYGVFFNVHSGCMSIDYFLKKNDFNGAARIATAVMHQEMFESVLLNFLCVYAALKWTEQRAEDRTLVLTNPLTDNSESSDEDVRVFKFPFLKNDFSDGHFDLNDGNQCIGKTLLWTAKHLNLEPELSRSIAFLGFVFYGDFLSSLKLLKESQLLQSSVERSRCFIEQLASNTEGTRANYGVGLENMKAALNDLPREESLQHLSAILLKKFESNLPQEERKVVEEQRQIFERWNMDRLSLIRNQTEKVNYMLRLADIEEERCVIEREKELRHFFENRLHWEDLARSNDEIYKEFNLMEAEMKTTEEQYVRAIFEKAKQRKVPLSKL